ncbi:MAG: hypothetical protein AAGJ97_00960 [Planctomycetota bacterium]
MAREFSGRLFLITFAASLAATAGTDVLLDDAIWSALVTAGSFAALGFPWGLIATNLAEEAAAARVDRMFASEEADPAAAAPAVATPG